MILCHVNLRSNGDRRGSKSISVFAFWQVQHNETIRIGFTRSCIMFWAKKACDIMQPKMTLSKDHWSKLNVEVDLKGRAEIWSWGFKLSRYWQNCSDIVTNQQGTGAPSMSPKTTLLLSDLAWYIPGALSLRICEIMYGLHTRSGLAPALAVYALHLKT